MTYIVLTKGSRIRKKAKDGEDPLLIILLFTIIATIAAVYAPAKRIQNISVTETINEL